MKKKEKQCKGWSLAEGEELSESVAPLQTDDWGQFPAVIVASNLYMQCPLYIAAVCSAQLHVLK